MITLEAEVHTEPGMVAIVERKDGEPAVVYHVSGGRAGCASCPWLC